MSCSLLNADENEAFEKFIEFEKLVTNEAGTTIAILRSDNSGEYISNEFESYLKSKGISHEPTVPHTPYLYFLPTASHEQVPHTTC